MVSVIEVIEANLLNPKSPNFELLKAFLFIELNSNAYGMVDGLRLTKNLEKFDVARFEKLRWIKIVGNIVVNVTKLL